MEVPFSLAPQVRAQIRILPQQLKVFEGLHAAFYSAMHRHALPSWPLQVYSLGIKLSASGLIYDATWSTSGVSSSSFRHKTPATMSLPDALQQGASSMSTCAYPTCTVRISDRDPNNRRCTHCTTYYCTATHLLGVSALCSFLHVFPSSA